MQPATDLPQVVYIGLGSNLETPIHQLRTAIARLKLLAHSQLIAVSRFYGSRPQGPQDQPPFVNAAVQMVTRLSPHELLDQLQALEDQQGRIRLQHWGPRTLDLDLLLYGDAIIQSERLQVPHPQLVQRDFVLRPLLDINPTLVLPDGRGIQSLLEACTDHGAEPLF